MFLSTFPQHVDQHPREQQVPVARSTQCRSVSRIGSGLAFTGNFELRDMTIHLPQLFHGVGFKKDAKTWIRKGN